MDPLTLARRARRALRTCAALLLLAAAGAAQISPPSLPMDHPWTSVMPVFDKPGDDTHVGGDGVDRYQPASTDAGPGNDDQDTLVDAAGKSDGVCDELNTKDGDNLDIVICGPEDVVTADPGDKVYIRAYKGQQILWYGTYAEYQRLRWMLRWCKDRLWLAHAGDPGAGWPDLLERVREDFLAATAVHVAGSASAWSLLPVGPYAAEVVPKSPADLLFWLWYGDADPVSACKELQVDAEQFEAARVATVQVLGHLESVLAGE